MVDLCDWKREDLLERIVPLHFVTKSKFAIG